MSKLCKLWVSERCVIIHMAGGHLKINQSQADWPFQCQVSSQLLPRPPVRKLPAHTEQQVSHMAPPPGGRARSVVERLPWQRREFADDALGTQRDAVDDEGAAHPFPQGLHALDKEFEKESIITSTINLLEIQESAPKSPTFKQVTILLVCYSLSESTKKCEIISVSKKQKMLCIKVHL